MKTKMTKTLHHVAAVAVLLLALCLVFAAPVSAETWYVATTGDDAAGTGSEESPFLTIHKAMDVASNGDTVIVKEGNYNVYCATDNVNLDIVKELTIKGDGNVVLYSYQGDITKVSAIYTACVKADNVTLENLTIYPVFYDSDTAHGNDYEVSTTGVNTILGKASLYMYYNQIVMPGTKAGNQKIGNLVVKNCILADRACWEPGKNGAGVYLDGEYLSGAYRVDGCTIYGHLTVCNNAGVEAESTDLIIKNNKIYCALAFNGERTTVGWNKNSITKLPTVSGNSYYHGGDYSFSNNIPNKARVVAWFCDVNPELLISEDILLSYVPAGSLAGGIADRTIFFTYLDYGEGKEKYHIIYVAEPVALVNGEPYSVFNENENGPFIESAVEAAKDGGTITLLKDVVLSESLTIAAEKSITLDLAGHTLKWDRTETADAAGDYSMIVNNGQLTIKDSSNNGKIIFNQTGVPSSGSLNLGYQTIRNYGTLAIESGIIEMSCPTEVVAASVPRAIDVFAGTVTITGGEVINKNASAAIRVFGDSINTPKLIVNGGTVTGAVQLHNPEAVTKGSVEIKAGTIQNIAGKPALLFTNYSTAVPSEMKITITGGTITGDFLWKDNAGEPAAWAPGVLTITGGTFSTNPSAYIASGYEVVQPGSSFVVQKYVDRSSSGSSSPVEPEEPEVPVEPETPTAPGEVASSTEVVDGGEVAFETPAGEDGTPAAAADSEIKGVVLPTGTEGTVEFVPVSEQPAPAGKEAQTKRVFEINVPQYEDGKASVIKFQMTVAEIEADGKTAADVALWHYDEETGEWTKLVTSFIIKDGIVYFEAITNDFSPFAIIYEDEPAGDLPTDTPETPEQPEEPASPAPVLAVLAALGAAVVLRRK